VIEERRPADVNVVTPDAPPVENDRDVDVQVGGGQGVRVTTPDNGAGAPADADRGVDVQVGGGQGVKVDATEERPNTN
jgi:hypothetical protein